MLLMCVPSVPDIMLQEHLVLTGHKISNLQPQNVWEWNMKCVLVKGFATITFSWELRLFFFAAALAFCLNCSNCWQIRSFHPISPRSLSPWLGWDKTEEMRTWMVVLWRRTKTKVMMVNLLWLWFSSPLCNTGHGLPSSSPSSRPDNPSHVSIQCTK